MRDKKGWLREFPLQRSTEKGPQWGLPSGDSPDWPPKSGVQGLSIQRVHRDSRESNRVGRDVNREGVKVSKTGGRGGPAPKVTSDPGVSKLDYPILASF
jgi:hypothetical protein